MPIEVKKGRMKVNKGSIIIKEDIPGSLYDFTSFAFQGGNNVSSYNCTDNFQSYYKSTMGASYPSWMEDPSNFNFSNGVQIWTVPKTGKYQINLAGSRSGSCYTAWSGVNYGSGMQFTTNYNLTQGQKLKIVVGLMGGNTSGSCAGSGGGGGGASWVVDYDSGNPIAIAAGGGGGGQDIVGPPYWTAVDYGDANNLGAPFGYGFANNGRPGTGGNGGTAGSVGYGGNAGGGTSCAACGGGGGGFYSDAVATPMSIPVDRGLGWPSHPIGINGGYPSGGIPAYAGGFGGGGGTGSSGYCGGGGGGYSGGGGGGLDTCACNDLGGGGGGGSYKSSTYWDSSSSVTYSLHAGRGYVTITFIG